MVTVQRHYYNARDPMPNPDQTRIFYKASQTRLTRAKCDPVDPDDPDDHSDLVAMLVRNSMNWQEKIATKIYVPDKTIIENTKHYYIAIMLP